MTSHGRTKRQTRTLCLVYLRGRSSASRVASTYNSKIYLKLTDLQISRCYNNRLPVLDDRSVARVHFYERRRRLYL